MVDNENIQIQSILSPNNKDHIIQKEDFDQDQIKIQEPHSMKMKEIQFSQEKSIDIDIDKQISVYDQQQDTRISQGFYEGLIKYIPQGFMVFNKELQPLFLNDKCERAFNIHMNHEIIRFIQKEIKNLFESKGESIVQFSHNSKKSRISNISNVQQQSQENFEKQQNQSSLYGLFPNTHNTVNLDKPLTSIKMALNLNINNNEGKIKIIKIRIFRVTSQIRQQMIMVLNSYREQQANQIPEFFITINNAYDKQIIENVQNEFLFKNKLIASFSHELRTPLNLSYLSLESAKNCLSNGMTIVLQNIQQAMGQLNLLSHQINNILDSAQLSVTMLELKLTKFYIVEIIQEIDNIYREAWQVKNINFSFEIDEHWISNQISSDYDRIAQVLVTLMDNSIKFCCENGQIKINIEKFLMRNSFQMSIQVIDNGIGIQYDRMQQINVSLGLQTGIFKHNALISEEHVGLGLQISNSITKKLSLEMDQGLIIKSEPLIKTTIEFYIMNQFQNINWASYENSLNKSDIANSLEVQLESKISKIQASVQLSGGLQNYQDLQGTENQQRQQQKTQLKDEILIVDDVPFNHLALCQILQQKYQQKASQAFSGTQAIQQVIQRIEQNNIFKLIFMDIEMPGLDGFETTLKILEICKNNQLKTNIIMCSAYDSQENLNQGKASGMNDFITKPVKPNKLKYIIEKYL